ncbi:hypothetical protein MKX01_037464 [Papaver californicum]|nr:hypothetical protein MKX01_037464 [Papaver californicum]
MSLRLTTYINTNPNFTKETQNRRIIDLGEGSEIIYVPRFVPSEQSWKWFDYLDKEIPWVRPTIQVYGRSCSQPRDTCYVASKGLQGLRYSGYTPHAYSWDDFPPLKDILAAVHEALPGSSFNSLLLNKYRNGSDYVSWHADDEKVYGQTPEIASISFGCERDFQLRKRPAKNSSLVQATCEEQPPSKRIKTHVSQNNQHSFVPKHGSLLVMRGNTQRDWLHSVPKRAKADSVRINLTFRQIIEDKSE